METWKLLRVELGNLLVLRIEFGICSALFILVTHALHHYMGVRSKEWSRSGFVELGDCLIYPSLILQLCSSALEVYVSIIENDAGGQ